MISPDSRWARFRRQRAPIAALILVILIGGLCFAAPLVAPYPLDAIDLDNLRAPPSRAHPMGTDDLGRDVFSRLLYGGRISIAIGLLAALVGTAVGAAIGAAAGFVGRRVDSVLMRLTDVAFAVPTLPLLIILTGYADAALIPMVAIIGALSWMGTARVVRSEVLTVRAMPYLEAARALGAPTVAMIRRHAMPNVLGPLIVAATLAVANAIMIESALSFLGLGVQPPVPTWGNMLMDSQATMASKPWLTIFPGTAILLVVLAINFIGDGFRESLDPRHRTG
jgi:peptide/nickel transport system permease protein